MSLSYRRERQLRMLEAGLIRSDPYLASIMGIFGRIYAGQQMPGWEQMPSRVPAGRNGFVRSVTWIVTALTATAAAISILLSRGAGAPADGDREQRPQRQERADGSSPRPDAPA